jgi:hypothetical protein
MAETPYTLGAFIAELMRRQKHNNVSLAAAAGVSEGGIRNLLKVGIDPKAKDPDPRTLRRIADALGINAITLFRLAGYIQPEPHANSVRAEYLADVFDQLSRVKQDAVLGVLEAMTDTLGHKESIQEMRQSPSNAIAGLDLAFPHLARLMANQLIAHYQMESPLETSRIESDVKVQGHRWGDLPLATQRRVKALIEHKLSLDYHPTMVDPEWRK